MKTTFPICYYAYSKENEDITPYNQPGWISVKNSTRKDELNILCPKPWRYQKPVKTDTVPKWGQFSLYPGGGFVADLGYDNEISLGIIETLQRNRWLDLQSRNVILEFSAFNIPTNLLVVATYFYEIQPSGLKAPFQRIKTISVYAKENGSHQFYLICVLLFIIFVLLFLVRICYTIHKQRLRFFKFFWNWVEVLQVVFSVLAVVMNIVRSIEAVSTIRKMKANIFANVNFQEVIAWTEAENGVLGILVFLVTLKLLRLIRYNEHVAVFSRTLKASANLLSSFMVVFIIGFVAFVHFGILVFGPGTVRYSSLLKATYFQLELVLGKVKKRPIVELSNANRTFGKIFASMILLSLTILFMNFFIAAINDALLEAKNSIIPNKLYDLVDESRLDKNELKKRLFDTISNLIKQSTTTNKKLSELPSKEIADKLSEECEKKATIDFDLISNAIVSSRQQRKQESPHTKPGSNKRKSFYNKVSVAIKQLSRALITRDTNLQMEELHKREEQFFQRLDNIILADYDEEEAFNLLCHQI